VTYTEPKLYVLSMPMTLPCCLSKHKLFMSEICLSWYKMTLGTQSFLQEYAPDERVGLYQVHHNLDLVGKRFAHGLAIRRLLCSSSVLRTTRESRGVSAMLDATMSLLYTSRGRRVRTMSPNCSMVAAGVRMNGSCAILLLPCSAPTTRGSRNR